MNFKTIEWKGDRVRLLDQRKLPAEVCYLECRDASAVAEAIRNMSIRGAPAIGVAAAMGIALAAKAMVSLRPEVFRRKMEGVCLLMRQTRPTAVNLFWAVGRMMALLDRPPDLDVCAVSKRLEQEALRIFKEDVEINRRIGTQERS